MHHPQEARIMTDTQQPEFQAVTTRRKQDSEAHTREPDPDRLKLFLERWAADQAATMHAATVVVGDELGLYRALAEGGPQTAEQLAAATGCNERLIREWLHAQVASAYCEHDPANATYWLNAEQAACLADDASTTFVAGGALVSNSNHCDVERVIEAFRGNGGIGWHEHHHHLFGGTLRFFEPVYRANLIQRWIPALSGVEQKLLAGGKVADIGCGQGASLILMARAFPESEFVGFDYHAESIETAKRHAEQAGVSDRVRFEVAGAQDFPGHGFDLVCVLNALHEWGDAIGAARHIRQSLAPEGSWMFTEPQADEVPQVSVRARTFYSVSTFVCTPSALSQEGGESLGAQAGEARLRRVVEAAGFTRFRRATETPTFMVLEARP
jgi:2-polyprenyl-3-methyl-5-hydroxy-6-metoxy-1,4-benzoquinol methylase